MKEGTPPQVSKETIQGFQALEEEMTRAVIQEGRSISLNQAEANLKEKQPESLSEDSTEG